MTRTLFLFAVFVLAGCAGPRLPPPNSATAEYDPRDNAVHVLISGLQPATEAALVDQDGRLFPAVGFSVISGPQDRKSTRLNSSHSSISYAVFCLKKKNIM